MPDLTTSNDTRKVDREPFKARSISRNGHPVHASRLPSLHLSNSSRSTSTTMAALSEDVDASSVACDRNFSHSGTIASSRRRITGAPELASPRSSPMSASNPNAIRARTPSEISDRGFHNNRAVVPGLLLLTDGRLLLRDGRCEYGTNGMSADATTVVLPKRLLGSAMKCLVLLDVIAAEPGPAGVSELARLTRTARGTTYQRLQTLVAAGWVEPMGDGKYRLTLRALVIGNRRPRASRPRVADTADTDVASLDEPAKRRRSRCSTGTPPMIIQRVASDRALKADIKAGTRMPARHVSLGAHSDRVQR